MYIKFLYIRFLFVGPFIGGTTPDINGPGLFLRGGDDNSVLEVEDSQIMEHVHMDPGHSHSCSASSTAADHAHSYTKFNLDQFTYSCGSGCHANREGTTRGTSAEKVIVTTECDVDSQSANLGGVDTNNVNAGDENRPANMKVVYIIRIY